MYPICGLKSRHWACSSWDSPRCVTCVWYIASLPPFCLSIFCFFASFHGLYLLFDILYQDDNRLFFWHRQSLYVVYYYSIENNNNKKHFICIISCLYIIKFSVTPCNTSHNGQEQDPEYGNSVLPGANTLPAMAH